MHLAVALAPILTVTLVAAVAPPAAAADTSGVVLAGKLTFYNCITPPVTPKAVEVAFEAVKRPRSESWQATLVVVYGWWSEIYEWCNLSGAGLTDSGAWREIMDADGNVLYTCMDLPDAIGRGTYTFCVRGPLPRQGAGLVGAVVCADWAIDCAYNGTPAYVVT